MLEAARHRFWLAGSLGPSISRVEHLQSIWKQSGEKPKELDGPPMPELGAHLWSWFSQLHKARQGPITYSEIEAWARLTGNSPQAWEVQAIKEIDVAYLKHQTEEAKSG